MGKKGENLSERSEKLSRAEAKKDKEPIVDRNCLGCERTFQVDSRRVLS